MAASKAELKNAFEAGRRAPRGGDPFETYWEAVQDERRLDRIDKKRIAREIEQRRRDDFRKRNGLD